MSLHSEIELGKKKAAVEALQEVSRKARIFLSMPSIEGITPRALMQSPNAETVDAGE